MENIQRHDGSLPDSLLGSVAEEVLEVEIDILEYVERGREIPHGRTYRTKVDCEPVRVDTLTPTGQARLASISTRNSLDNAIGMLGELVRTQANWMISFLPPNQGIGVG